MYFCYQNLITVLQQKIGVKLLKCKKIYFKICSVLYKYVYGQAITNNMQPVY